MGPSPNANTHTQTDTQQGVVSETSQLPSFTQTGQPGSSGPPQAARVAAWDLPSV